MALKHAFVSAKSDGADTTLVQPSNWNAAHTIDTDGVAVPARTDVPATPSTDNVVVFAKKFAGTSAPAWVDDQGVQQVMQGAIGQRRTNWYLPLPGSTSTNGALVGLSPSTLGTVTAKSPTNTNLFTAGSRVGYYTGTTTGSRGLWWTGAQYIRGDSTVKGGFKCVFRFGVSDASFVTGSCMFVGMSAASTILGSSTNPDASLNIFGVGFNANDTNLRIYRNDGAGTASSTDLGASFPATTISTDVYELVVFCAPVGTSMSFTLTRVNTGDVTSGTYSTDIPAQNTFLNALFARGNNGVASSAGIDVFGFYSESLV